MIPAGDPVLAAFMQKVGAGANLEPEMITATDWLLTAFNRKALKIGQAERFVDLACGHKAVTKNRRHVQCWKCRYLVENGYDYDAFRNLRTIRDPLDEHWDEVIALPDTPSPR